MSCDECVFDSEGSGALPDDVLLDRLDRCGDCPAVARGPGLALLTRLRASAKAQRRVGSHARQLARELAELRREVDRSEQRIANLERVQKVSTRELQQKTAQLAMIADIAIAANEADSEGEIYDACMRQVCAATGWALARALPAGGGPARWHLADPRTGPLQAALGDEPTALARRAAEDGRPWRDELGEGAPWSRVAAALGLRDHAALPVRVDDEAAVVFEFFGAGEEGDAVAAPLVAMTTIADQLGRVLARRRAEEVLAQARDDAEEASRSKSAFLANMSHELRTPLNAILGYAELLHELVLERGADDLGEDILRIRQAGEHLLGLINNILDLSKIEAGRMEVLLERFDAGAHVRAAAAMLQPLAARRDNTIDLVVARDLGHVETDPTIVRQLLFNLISNAAKFTERGRITVEAARELDPGGAPWLRLAVTDTGIGMTPEQLEQVFEAYRQADPRIARRFGGTGLGLSLCRGLCALLGGTIVATSTPGAGSRFTVRLPAGRPRRLSEAT